MIFLWYGKTVNIFERLLKKDGKRFELRSIIWLSFTIIAATATFLMGISFYYRFSKETERTILEGNSAVIEQVGYNFGVHIRNMMKVSDSLYYSVIKDNDIENIFNSESLKVIYDINKDYIESIELFSYDGNLLECIPTGRAKENVNIKNEPWYKSTITGEENVQFGMPVVSKTLKSVSGEYTRVIPMSRVVQMNEDGKSVKGILLINLKYSSIQDLLSDSLYGDDSYFYLTDSEGNIIYHPMQQLMETGNSKEEYIDLRSMQDGFFIDKSDGTEKEVFITTVGYTGWKIVSVTEGDGIALNTFKNKLFIAFLIMFFLSAIVILNLYISKKVTEPLRELEKGVKEIEDGNLDAKINADGFYEVWSLSRTVSNMEETLKQLMADIVTEHEAKRESDLMVLQNQINPHFLYNTLDIIVWMIENEKSDNAVKAVMALAKFFRISLSKGRNFITVEDEIEHVRSYLTIQEMRFKDRFKYTLSVDEEAKKLYTIKLVLQPIVENAVYHAMEFMDGDGEIIISAKKEGDDIVMTVKDNGCGMTEETVESIFKGDMVSSKKGSGVGIRNVHQRIQLVFGEKYGVFISSEPDEGTEVTVKMPAVTAEKLDKRGLK